MEKYERRIRKNKRRKRRNAIIIVTSFIILFSIGLFIGEKKASKKSIVVSTNNNALDSQQKKSDNDTTKDRQGVINEGKKNSTDAFDPYKEDGRKVAYLTFDDGPSPNNTPKILDILKSNNIKATFFIIGKYAEKNTDLVKREQLEGHTVGNHSYSHDMKHIYSSPSNFIDDLNKGDKAIKSILGEDYSVKLIRFPGGSSGSKLAPFRKAARKEGYHYVDWNDLTGDAERSNVPVNVLLSNLQKYTTKDHVVILMHDAPAKTTTVQALPQVIDYLKSKGYTFDTL